MEKIRIGGFILLFERISGSLIAISITGFEGNDSKLVIDDEIVISDKKYIVTSIEKKAFLGCKGLRSVSLPESVQSIGDWAFAQCTHLNRFEIRGSAKVVIDENEEYKAGVLLGRGVFEGCKRLNYLSFYYVDESMSNTSGIDNAKDIDTTVNLNIIHGMDNMTQTVKKNNGAPYLTGCIVTRLNAPYLLYPKEIGSLEWYRQYDNALVQYLKQSDYAGADSNVLCGEEDISYDDIPSVDGELLGENAQYIQNVRKSKCYLCLVRLRYDAYIDNAIREFYEEYIKAHANKKGDNSSWQAIKDNFQYDKEFFLLYLNIIEPDDEMLDLLLDDLGGGHPQAKAQLLNYQNDRRRNKKEDKIEEFFETLLI